MEGSLSRNCSSLRFGNEPHPGCMSGLFHMLNFHHRHGVKKKHQSKRRGGGKRRPSGAKYSRLKPDNFDSHEREASLDAEIDNLQVKENMPSNTSTCNESEKSSMGKVISEENKHQLPSFPSRFQRIYSIHHLEPSHHNLPDQVREVAEIAKTDLDQLKSKENLLKKEDFDSVELNKDTSIYRTKEFMDSLETLKVNETFLKILEDPKCCLAHHVQSLHSYKVKRGLAKCESFPVGDSLSRMNIKLDKLKENRSVGRQEKKSQSGNLRSLLMQINSYEDINALRMNSMVDDNAFDELKKKQGENEVVINRFKNIKKMIRHAITESKKGRRISMDAILHKIPYGRSFSKDAKSKTSDPWKESTNDISIFISGKVGQSRIGRSHSLNELLDKYSELFKSSFGDESEYHPSEKFKLTNEEGSFSLGHVPKTLGRIHSLPNLESYWFLRTEVPVDDRQLDSLVKSASCRFDRPLMESISENNGPGNAEVSGSIDDKSNLENGEACLNTKYEEEPESTNSERTKMARPSPISVLEPCFQEDVISPAKFSISSIELEPRQIDFEDIDDKANLQDQSITESLGVFEITVDLEKLKKSSSMSLPSDFLHVQVDTNDEANFNYVRDVLKLSEFSGNEYLGTWHSPEQPVDPSLFDKMEACSPPKSGCDHQILFDIINVVLLEVYDKSFSYWPRPLSCNCHIRPMPKGYCVLEEVWSRIQWYLSSQPELDPSLDYFVSRDISKDDGWMNLQFESECVGIELEEMIWDDILDEVLDI